MRIFRLHTPYTALLPALLFLLASCTFHRAGHPLLSLADSLLDSCPDSALHLLESLPPDALHDEADRARYALLMTQARDKNYLPHTDDSLIRIAVDYYDRTQETEMQARSYYVWGGVYRDRNENGMAIRKYALAIGFARKAQNIELQKLILSNIGYLYFLQGYVQQADSIYQETEGLAILSKDTILWAETLIREGRLKYQYEKDLWAAEQKLLKAQRLSSYTSHDELGILLNTSLSELYSYKQEGEKMLRYARQSLALQKDTSQSQWTFTLLGEGYFLTHQYDSAIYFLNRGIQTSNLTTKSKAYMCLAKIYKEQGNAVEEVNMLKAHSACLDSINAPDRYAKFANAEKEMESSARQKVERDFEESSRHYLMTLAIICMLTLFCIWKIYSHISKQKAKSIMTIQKAQEELQGKYLTSQELLKQEKDKNSLAEAEIKMMQSTENIRQEVNELIEKRNTLTKEAAEQSFVYEKMKAIISNARTGTRTDLKMENEDWRQLIALTDKRWNDITFRLQETYGLSQNDIRICCLYLTDMSISDMQFILDCTRDTVYKKGYAILEKSIGVSHKEISLKKFLRSF